MNESNDDTKLLSPEESYTRRMWAIRQWGFPEDISRDRLAGEILDGLESVVLMPARERQQAIFWLRGSIPSPGPEDGPESIPTVDDAEDDRGWLYEPLPDDSHIDRFTYLIETGREAMEDVELFSELFFLLAPDERRRRFDSLRRRCADEPASRARLAQLEGGLDLPKLPEGDRPISEGLSPPREKLLRAIYHTLPLRPGPRLVERERFREQAAMMKGVDWQAEIESIRQEIPVFAQAGEPLFEILLTGDAPTADALTSAAESSNLETLLGDKPMKETLGSGDGKPIRPAESDGPPDPADPVEDANDLEGACSAPAESGVSKYGDPTMQCDMETSELVKELIGPAQSTDIFDDEEAEAKVGRYDDDLSKRIMSDQPLSSSFGKKLLRLFKVTSGALLTIVLILAAYVIIDMFLEDTSPPEPQVPEVNEVIEAIEQLSDNAELLEPSVEEPPSQE